MALPLFALDIIQVDWWQWVITLAFASRLLYTGLSRTESQRQEKIAKAYPAAAQQICGKYAAMKTNLPWILAGGFFAAALLIRFVFDVVIPGWIAVCFVVILTVSVCYSMGLDRAITAQIDKGED